jgi:hypothetical protein
MAGEKSRQDPGFTVIDRRASAGGAAAEPAPERNSDPGAPPKAASGAPPGPASEPESKSASGPPRRPAPELPHVDFSTFVLSLGTSALYHLGVVAHPETGKKVNPPELALARNTIDTLEMLEEKTRGNLDEQERELVESLLYELRMRFVEAGRSGS